MKSSKLRFYLPFLIVLLFGLYANVDIVKMELRRSHRPGILPEIAYEARLAPLKKYLPRDAIVGYVTDRDLVGQRAGYFFLTQYNLPPIMVLWGKTYPYVIGDYYGLDNPNKSETADLVPVKDFGAGTELYRGTRQ